ncbi:hypothetical protein AVEN_111410-1 [Araneus ventricosus]|uniref:Uncharacterized protein n=1 Tax=Araneus ventricosus TaxID=182803 RepID=A0A4Y2K2N5_ARAVE|nr:hypothetical protein AVEN_111410-1 [Araneus ventricosus]
MKKASFQSKPGGDPVTCVRDARNDVGFYRKNKRRDETNVGSMIYDTMDSPSHHVTNYVCFTGMKTKFQSKRVSMTLFRSKRSHVTLRANEKRV